MRHGQTYFMLENRLGGDSELTPFGFEQAAKISKWLADIDIKAVYCSTLKRSVQTAEVLHKSHPKTPLIQTSELCELSNGDMDSIKYEEFEQEFPKLFKARSQDKYHWCFPNGESYETALLRVKPLLESLKSKNGNYIIVGHQAMNRVILGQLLGLTQSEIPFLVIPNDVVFVIDIKNKKVSHIKDGKSFDGYTIE